MKTTDDKNELFTVVDKNDNIIGYKTREECHSDKSLIHRSASVVIFNKKREILLQKRSMTKDLYPGYYAASASGHVGKGETYEQAAKREMKEEIGVKANIKFKAKFLVDAPNETEIASLFTAIFEGPFETNKEEVDDVVFMSQELIKDIKDKLTPTAFKCMKNLGIL